MSTFEEWMRKAEQRTIEFDRRIRSLGASLAASAPEGGGFMQGGGFPTTAPPNGTTGTLVTITRAGAYLLTAQMSGYSTVVGGQTVYLYVDGAIVSAPTYFFNSINEHLVMTRMVAVVSLTAGPHYIYLRTTATSNGDDWGSVTWNKTG